MPTISKSEEQNTEEKKHKTNSKLKAQTEPKLPKQCQQVPKSVKKKEEEGDFIVLVLLSSHVE